MNHIRPPGGDVNTASSSMVVYITSDISTTGIVEVADGSFTQNFNVTANAVTIVNVPGSAFVGNQGKALKGIHIKSLKPIAVYAHIYAESVSGATLLLPVNALGKDYMSINYKQISNAGQKEKKAYSTIAVVATEDNTTVEITPTETLAGGEPKGVTFIVELQKGEVYQALSFRDLTGTRIKSVSTASGGCKRVAVFSGSSKIGIGCSPPPQLTSDNLFQQVYATSAWGKNYITAPLSSRSYDMYRIVLSDPATTITLNGTVIPGNQITNGLYYEFASTSTNVISANKPVQVVQYAISQNEGLNCTRLKGDVGDPEMIYLSPVEQGLEKVTLYSTGYFKIVASYVNVVLPTSAVASFTLDGVPYTAFKPVTGKPEYSFAQIHVSSGPSANGTGSVTSGTHTIKADKPFNAIAYGFGNADSYGYAAGTNQLDLNTHLVLSSPTDNTKSLTSACAGTLYKLKLTLPYQTPRITWDIGNGTAPLNQTTLTPVSTTVTDGLTLYNYEYPNAVFYPVGNYSAMATVFNPIADDCGSEREIPFFFESIASPVSAINMPLAACLNDEIEFKSASVPVNNSSAKAWLWNFGDDSTSSLQNPKHAYNSAGDYTVSLTIFDNNGCSAISTKVIHIFKLPVAAFKASELNCVSENIVLIDNSSAEEGNIISRRWNFGDGTAVTELSTSAPISHVFVKPGVYTISLSIITDKGCTSVYQNSITIHPRPVVNFVLPDACLDDVARFTDISSIADDTGDEFTYLWNFGDSNSSPAYNISDQKNGQHKYSAVGVYTVTLTVTSKHGCSSTKQLQFTVNGAFPVAKFEVQNHCSGSDIIFKDLSVPSFGNITKLVWYFDYDNHPEIAETYTKVNMHPDKLYLHNYGIFNTPMNKSYHVKLIAYAGDSQTCTNVFDEVVVVYANPIIKLSYNNQLVSTGITICHDNGSIKIKDDTGIFQGKGVFSGKGINQNGRFDPGAAGIGTFNINYVFTAITTGCTYAESFQITVNPSPVIQDDEHYEVFEGDKLQLKPNVSISSGTVSYSWTPTATLDHADIARPYAAPTENTIYTLIATSDKGCTSVKSIYVKVFKRLVVPNAFTPNSDGINDRWEIRYIDMYPNAKVDVFNRAGEKVYSSNGYATPWDGTSRGMALPIGTYYYIIDQGSGRKANAGYVSIIK